MHQPTVLLDEADTYLRQNGEVRPIINAGHKKGAQVARSVGDQFEPRAFSVWAPMVIAGIGSQADTLEDRSVIIGLERKRPDEHRALFRSDRAPDAAILASQCARWAHDHQFMLSSADPVLPEGMHNRAADNWRPLLAVADAAGGPWPNLARVAASSLATEDASTGVQLLSAIRDIFEQTRRNPIWSEHMVTVLNAQTSGPWGEYRNGAGLSAAGLAQILEPFAIAPIQLKVGTINKRGYRFEQFEKAFARYLPKPVSTATPLPTGGNGAFAPAEGARTSDTVAPPEAPEPVNARR